MKKKFDVTHDKKYDLLYVIQEGEGVGYDEIAPGVKVEYDAEGNIIGIEILRASRLFKEEQKPLQKKLRVK